MKNYIKTIAFDADDTLWGNEHLFKETEQQFCALLEGYLPHSTISKELYKTEMKNLHLYGYGVKGFMLCMVETVLRISKEMLSPEIIQKTIKLGQDLLQKPIELLPEVEETLKYLSCRYKLVLATKGDLLDQERKLRKSGLQDYFHHINIMSDKQVLDYKRLLNAIRCAPENFLMLGNSLKSDVLPVLELGGFAAHIPYQTTWLHEQVNHNLEHPHFYQLKNIREILNYLQ